MKTLLGAIALFAAAPVAAQTAPAANPQADHAQHQQQGQAGHSEHKMDCCKEGKCGCCEKMKQQGSNEAGAAHHEHGPAQQGHSGH